ncbi:AraC family transcriptional regulator [Pelagicoccus sp. SDUM812003]|uniref:AraC family transcriptional regulator n=1 Tax=Pelagicoccus sp. SDUM812003 TaxID=3041267 RepID=UPI0028104861|nr:AraC family transcriptional regulator [Pelagicoccus sp. SDUM812003]MDQ8201454.1 AraC family transcriptional regulator [Pelagicoccus sp. SDUM812003]
MKAQIEQIIPSARHSFICRCFSEPRFDHPFHYHPEIELTYITRSSGTRIVGDHVGTFDPGDLCLIGENLPHIYRNTFPTSNGAESEVLHLSRDCVHGFIDTAPELAAFSDMLDQAKLGLSFDDNTAHTARFLLAKIRESDGVQRWIAFLQLVEHLLAAPKPRILASPGFIGSINQNVSQRMHRICQYILEHFDEELTHKDLAKQAHMSPAYFSRQFKKSTRKTYQDFLTNVRLGHVCHLLIETDMPIVEIAFSSGFRNLSNFNRSFHRTYHCSPRDYRERHSNAQEVRVQAR